MAFITLEGSVGTLDVIVFPTVYEDVKELLVPGRIVVVGGKLDSRTDREDHPLLANWFKEPHTFPLPTDEGKQRGAAQHGGLEAPSTGHQAHETPTGYTPSPSSAGEDMASIPSAAQPPWEAEASQDPQGPITHRMAEDPPAHRPAVPTDAVTHPPTQLSREAQPAMLYVTLKRTGDNVRDFEKLAKVHATLQVPDGHDPFIIILEGAGRKPVELTFPNERTRLTPQLQRKIASLVGEGNLRIVYSSGLPGGHTHVDRDPGRSPRQEAGAPLH